MKSPHLTKLKSALKKLPSLSHRPTATAVAAGKQKHAVYVGKSRRRYEVSSEVMCHPLFQEMVDRSNGSDAATVAISCEVVMFDHLLWMIQNSADAQLGSMVELVQYYSY